MLLALCFCGSHIQFSFCVATGWVAWGPFCPQRAGLFPPYMHLCLVTQKLKPERSMQSSPSDNKPAETVDCARACNKNVNFCCSHSFFFFNRKAKENVSTGITNVARGTSAARFFCPSQLGLSTLCGPFMPLLWCSFISIIL